MLRTRMTTLAFIPFELFFLDRLNAIPCPLSILKTIRNTFMRLYCSLEEIVTM